MIQMPRQDESDLTISKRVGRNVFDTPPRISVVIPAYNSAQFINDTLESVLNQKYREHEIIVVNDGSPDTEQFERAIKLKLEDIVYIRQRNAGAGVARNTAIRHARGQIIAFLDADDMWMPDYLASQYVFMERNGYDMVYSDAMMFGLNSAYKRTFMDTAPSNGIADFDSILDLKCNVITSGTMARRSKIVEAGLFETERVRSHDFHLWLRMAKNGAKIGYQKKPLLKYRVHLDSLSGNSISRVERERDAFERVKSTIALTEEQTKIVDARIAGLKADLAVENGKSHLISGSFKEAAELFRTANQHRRSVKLMAAALLTRLIPRTFCKVYVSSRPAEIRLIPRKN